MRPSRPSLLSLPVLLPAMLLALLGIAAPVAASPAASAPPGYALLDGARAGQLVLWGEKSARVAALQTALNRVGASLVVDGDFGGRTWAAVRGFQARSQLSVDGLVGRGTMTALDRALGLTGAPAPPPPPPPPPAPLAGQALALPPRAFGAETGTAFLQRTAGLSRADRESAVLAAVLSGNVPARQRTLVPVRFAARTRTGQLRDVTIYVARDYLSIGSDQDFVRMPMTARTAQRIADVLSCSLPTPLLVDRIHQHADFKLRPIPLTPGAWMITNAAFLEHDRRLDVQTRGLDPDALLAGLKKDLVILRAYQWRPDRVAIYGWHWPNGRPIQPRTTVHHWSYADYSHGLRLVSRTVEIDGTPFDLVDVLADRTLAPLLSDEGALRSPRVPGV